MAQTEALLNNKDRLNDVVIIRPVLIICLVFYHSFAIYNVWEPITGFPEISIYRILDKFSYAFMLEMFVFVSGYVFGFQVKKKGEAKLEPKSLFGGKFKRLMIPSLFFSLLYLILFDDISANGIFTTIYVLFLGVGHMWYLPVLFSCFVFVWVIEKLKLPYMPVLIILFFCSFIPKNILPFNIGYTLYYMLFFEIGYLIQSRDISFRKFFNCKCCAILSTVFLTSFIVETIIRESLIQNGGGYYLIVSFLKVVFSYCTKIAGLAALFLLANTYIVTYGCNFSKKLLLFGRISMGIYLLQQFILVIIYYYTPMPSIFGPFFLPWVGFLIALILSTVLSYVLSLTRFGRLIIG